MRHVSAIPMNTTRAILFWIALSTLHVAACRAGDDSYPYVGSWRGHQKESDRVGVGSCILIAPSWVLTAAHVAKPLAKGADDREVRITFPGDITRTAVSAVCAKDQDIALARLDTPVTNIAPVALQSIRLTKQRHGLIPIVIVGTSGGRKALEGHQAVGAPPLMLRIPNEKLVTGKGGDSGGAWILKQTDDPPPLLVAVLSGGVQLDGKQYGRGIQPSCVREWIDTTLATNGSAAVWKEISGRALEANPEAARDADIQ
jgi:hypothetical protein